LTAVPVSRGFWTAWLPFALPQRWPFCWWVAVAVDHFSRRVMGCAAFASPPTSEAVRAFLGRTMQDARATPKYIVCDKGPQFWNQGFKGWCRRKGIRPRFGAVGEHGSIAVVERLILTLKQHLSRLPLVPLRRDAFRRELGSIVAWYNQHRPHMTLAGKTPDETYFHRFPACRRPRFEPRGGWPRGSACARPHALVKGRPGTRLDLGLAFPARRRYLPIVTVRRTA
jgi:transposase InsO family protein